MVASILFPFSIGAQSLDYYFDLSGNLVSWSTGRSAPPIILNPPHGRAVALEEIASFSVVLADASGASYQWRFNAAPGPGATTDTLLISHADFTSEGLYDVIVANSSGSVTSAPAPLLIDSFGGGMPDSWQLAFFGNFNQNPAGDFDGDGVSNLDEFLEGTDPTDPASFRPRLQVQAVPYGSIFATPSLPSYALGQYVTLTAVPLPGARFVQWGGAVTGTKDQIALLMNGHKSVSATFALLPAPAVFQTVNLAGNSITLAWSSVAGLSYQLQYSTNLSQASWVNLGAVLKASGATITTSDIVSADAQRFYRLNVFP